MLEPGSLLALDVEKPAAGGRMLARHQGQVVLVWGAIPGERVTARVDRVRKGVVYAETVDVLSASSDRRELREDWRCGGNVFAFVSYPRQLQLKAEIIRDAFGRIARVPLAAAPEVVGSPEQGYRMRARLHAHDGKLGFFRESTHQLCDAAATGQLLPATVEWISTAQQTLTRERLTGLAGIEIAENMAGDARAGHLELQTGINASSFAPLAAGLVGLSAERSDRGQVERIAGTPAISDVLHLRDGDPASTLQLRRDVRAFFQANRFLLERLARHVTSLVPPGPVVDLYAGVGLFGLSLAATGREAVTLVEGDPVSSADLHGNAERFRGQVRVERRSVENYLRTPDGAADATYVIDPPRTGLSKDALAGIIRNAPAHIVYVSCDVATLARDSRTLIDAGYELGPLTAMDLFPNTAHVETIATFSRSATNNARTS